MFNRSRRAPKAALVAALVAVSLAACSVSGSVKVTSKDAVDTTTSGGADTVVEETGEVVITGETLPSPRDVGVDGVVGLTAPEVTGSDFDGSPVSITADGTPKVVVFLASWCSHCQAELPVLVDWLSEGGLPEGVEMVAVSSLYKSEYHDPPSVWLEREGWPLPVLRDDAESTVARSLGLPGTPYFVFLDGHNEVRSVLSGNVPTDVLDTSVAAIAPQR